ncbi:MAG: hypothetical protein FH749_02245 [Firmicutes bacterium]|nr:hypothetical protein [Bacillota bacterium]
MWIQFITFIISALVMLTLPIFMFVVIRDFSNRRKRRRHFLVLAGLCLSYALIMLGLWGFTWVGGMPW